MGEHASARENHLEELDTTRGGDAQSCSPTRRLGFPVFYPRNSVVVVFSCVSVISLLGGSGRPFWGGFLSRKRPPGAPPRSDKN